MKDLLLNTVNNCSTPAHPSVNIPSANPQPSAPQGPSSRKLGDIAARKFGKEAACVDCSLSAYKKELLEKPSLTTLKEMNAKCAEKKGIGNVECSTSGYVKTVVNVIKPDRRLAEKAVEKAVGEVITVSGVGCVVGGTIGGIGGAIATFEAPFVGATIGATVGCKTGASIAPVAYTAYKTVEKVKDVVSTTIEIKNALTEQGKACGCGIQKKK